MLGTVRHRSSGAVSASTEPGRAARPSVTSSPGQAGSEAPSTPEGVTGGLQRRQVLDLVVPTPAEVAERIYYDGATAFLRRGGEVLVELTRPGRVDANPRSHRRRQGHRAEIAALGGGRLGPHQLLHHGVDVLEQLFLGERGLAHADVHVPDLVGAVLDPS